MCIRDRRNAGWAALRHAAHRVFNRRRNRVAGARREFYCRATAADGALAILRRLDRLTRRTIGQAPSRNLLDDLQRDCLEPGVIRWPRHITAVDNDEDIPDLRGQRRTELIRLVTNTCLLYTSDAADERSSVDLGGRRIIKKK